MALADLFSYCAREPEDPRVRGLGMALTVVAVPMVRPDPSRNGAAAGPESRALRDLADRFGPVLALDLEDGYPGPPAGEQDDPLAEALSAAESVRETMRAAAASVGSSPQRTRAFVALLAGLQSIAGG